MQQDATPASRRSIAIDISLFVILVLLTSILWPLPVPGSVFLFVLLIPTFYAVAFVHIAATLFDGCFSKWRTVTWVILTGAFFFGTAFNFLGWIMPTGQIGYWFARIIAGIPIIGTETFFNAASMAAQILAFLALPLALLLDIGVANWAPWRRRGLGRFLIFVLAAGAVSLLITFALRDLQPPRRLPQSSTEIFDILTTPAYIIPPWYQLWLFSVLRSIPDKFAGAMTMLAAGLLPVIWPWVRADLIRTSAFAWFWLAAWVLMVATWIGLAYVGTVFDGSEIYISQALTVYFFTFFLILPPVFHALLRCKMQR